MQELVLSGVKITAPRQAHKIDKEFNPDDGIGVYSPAVSLRVENCVVDLSEVPLDEQDEAVSVTWGSSAVFEYCLFRGAGKLALLGSGDESTRKSEAGKEVVFRNCVFEDFGRRGPEVQSGMECLLSCCIIRNWAHPSYFTVRGFGAWAHDGGRIIARDCVFENKDRLSLKQSLEDRAYHISQAVLDNGIKAIGWPSTYVAGWRRGLTGNVHAVHCYAGPGIVVENNVIPMTDKERNVFVHDLTKELNRRLGGLYAFADA